MIKKSLLLLSIVSSFFCITLNAMEDSDSVDEERLPLCDSPYLYNRLGIAVNASQEMIARAHDVAVRDVMKRNSENQFQETVKYWDLENINIAYCILRSESLRTIYDDYGYIVAKKSLEEFQQKGQQKPPNIGMHRMNSEESILRDNQQVKRKAQISLQKKESPEKKSKYS